MTEHRVRQVIWKSDEVFELEVERQGLEFQPGDCLRIYNADRSASRLYSMSSGIKADVLRFLIRRMPEGVVTNYLCDLKPGDSLRLGAPFGWFHPGQAGDSEPFVFIATGTGIAPFLSYLESYPERPPTVCLYGVRRAVDAVGYEILRVWCPTHLAVSREQLNGYHHGRVTGLLQHLPLDPRMHFYLCGLDTMIEEVSDWLDARRVDLDKIHRECFFNASL